MVSTVGFENQKSKLRLERQKNCRKIMFVLSPRPGLASFRRLTHGFTVSYFRTRLPALKKAPSGAAYL
jgi:hypothetical protein